MSSVWDKICSICDDYNILPIEELYPGWHNDRYLAQCYYNLEEKYDCGGIAEEWFEKVKYIYKKENNNGRI